VSNVHCSFVTYIMGLVGYQFTLTALGSHPDIDKKNYTLT